MLKVTTLFHYCKHYPDGQLRHRYLDLIIGSYINSEGLQEVWNSTPAQNWISSGSEQHAWSFYQLGLESMQGWRLHNLPCQPIPVLASLY